jgi:hypothetical protein
MPSVLAGWDLFLLCFWPDDWQRERWPNWLESILECVGMSNKRVRMSEALFLPTFLLFFVAAFVLPHLLSREPNNVEF